ncbi:hypothetical protein [Ureibacillus terrenus]|uniref:Uncharacterized protein n=1 Tax=Ureibacillus terrenus TaxID=118246 RepID=A0A540V5F7_9BACL|nr:hypothetical protein [Ureibacillus terrenus]MED3661199.1 hypothetical protein [Ureibacillus terrenus]TQE91995.1 hypothetical protein FKZ59_02585 [Ureibacillus terrenus]
MSFADCVHRRDARAGIRQVPSETASFFHHLSHRLHFVDVHVFTGKTGRGEASVSSLFNGAKWSIARVPFPRFPSAIAHGACRPAPAARLAKTFLPPSSAGSSNSSEIPII